MFYLYLIINRLTKINCEKVFQNENLWRMKLSLSKFISIDFLIE